jgi:hypothetical protein
MVKPPVRRLRPILATLQPVLASQTQTPCGIMRVRR